MRIVIVGTALGLIVLGQGPAHAQSSDAARQPFTGFYAGPEIGAHEHHTYLIETNAAGVSSGRYYRAWGVGGGAFAGYDLAVLPRLRLGLEAGLSVGGNNPVARFSDGSFFTEKPRYGFRATAKAGYLLSDRLLAYGTFGYGAHRYKIAGTATVVGFDEWGSSFTIGAGMEYRASERVGVRLDFRHLDNQMSHILVGIPIRF